MRMEFKEDEFVWCEELLIGIALTMTGYIGITDSSGRPISNTRFYKVGKHKYNGKIAIIPTEKDLKNDEINHLLKIQNRLN